ncbi:Rid family hydrolase [Phytoactinopolyspora mesophila]|uniref:RidA family protein n=1 Tax=Phytoactinopolyspora mesophila TaxID=2650750 RepID=A0A7K3M729_9ACTN|nr:Rid family hydrolase [Phytoactinopolyspora mesophila]NDL58218.1 RidA family protein [Phytoactinopolyspora mesophila]
MTRRAIGSENPFEDVYGYSRAVRAGAHIYVSGTTPREADLGADAYTQTRSALSIVEFALADLDARFDDVVRTTIYTTDLSDLDGIARAHAETFRNIRPASTVVQVTALTPAAAKVEIEVTAVTV